MSNARFSITPSRAVKDKDLSDSLFRTLSALGIYGDENGWCWPSLGTLAKDLNKSKPAVSKDIKMLREMGYLNVYKRFDEETGEQRSNQYQVRFDYPPLTPEINPPLPSEVNPPLTPEINLNDPSNDPSNDPNYIPPSPQKVMVGELAKVTGLDLQMNGGRLGRSASKLVKAGYLPETVERAYCQDGWWYKNDWRGRDKGEMPTPEQIVETIGRVDLREKVNGHGNNPTRRIILPDGQIVDANGG